MNNKIGFIGAGNMATVIINGLIINNYNSNNIYVFDIDDTKSKQFINKGIFACKDIIELVKMSDIVFLCVKPQNFPVIINDLMQGDKNKIFVSIAAGITTNYIKTGTGVNSKVIRTMPNTPMLLGVGATALCRTQEVSDDDFNVVMNIFKLLGIAVEIKEEQMNSVISVNASSPAYIYLFMDAMIKGAVELGIDEVIAKELICQTLIGSAMMFKNSEKSPSELIKMVASKGGTTIEALKVLDDNNFSKIIVNAMKACAKKANEIGVK